MQQAKIFRNLRKTGIDFLSEIPWGTHVCGFYQTKEDLENLLVPYFKVGLENNEYCLWVVSEPISANEAEKVLRESMPDFDTYQENNQIEIIPYKEWYLKYGTFDSELVLNSWVEKVKSSVERGYAGLRISGNTSWLKKRYFKTFMDYEKKVEELIGSLKMIAMCTYQLDQCGIHEVFDIVNNHQFSFIKSQYNKDNINSITRFERIDLVGKMAASIAHEIRNPMTSVKGFLQLLQSKKELVPYHDYFSLMIGELERANSIISEYLSLARIKDKSLKLESINNILQVLFPLIEADALKEDMYVTLELGGVEDLLIDANDIRQLVLNLARNGLEAMQSGGKLTIKTYIDGEVTVLAITDQGEGIKEDLYEKIGNPFFTTKDQGTGLGLAVCYNIAERNNATIDFKSGSNGTTFYVRFRKKGTLANRNAISA
ncbi:MEDS domain-containing protein [Desulfosporosinus sp. FKB]|uniref:MEDS domain-containing protein n=1 Tax=Desulfosporosinus sp. FKB TaxID=1969835 RepID=UPI001FA8A532|nr:MEDS domain-containing protein [Desulfosporosinus sp. FKB]